LTRKAGLLSFHTTPQNTSSNTTAGWKLPPNHHPNP